MTATELINPVIPPLKPTDTVLQALNWMEELRLTQLPVVDNGVYLGLLRDEAAEDWLVKGEAVEKLPLIDKSCFVYENQHFFDVIKAASDFQVQSVPVISKEGLYKGLITLEDTVNAIAQTAAVQSPGAVLVMSLKQIDYSMAEISRLIESEGAKILSSNITTDSQDAAKIKLTLKLNQRDLGRIIATLERFGYHITATFQETDTISNDKERLDILMRYLEM